ncbi:hypothetical protein Hanom_Chr11g01019821 [Helianthus anomalus]
MFYTSNYINQKPYYNQEDEDQSFLNSPRDVFVMSDSTGIVKDKDTQKLDLSLHL